jgi:Metallo-beta-lactamase superfamily.
MQQAKDKYFGKHQVAEGWRLTNTSKKMGPHPQVATCSNKLTAEGIAREEITNVVLTHAHPDHIGGILDTSGKPSFPNAQYVSKTEWDFSTSNPDLEQPETE